MDSKLLAIFTRTPLHVGSGKSVGAIDLPVIRERHTRFPVIPGSSIKGVLANLWNDENGNRSEDGCRIFGKTDANDAEAGSVALGEAKLLAFPVRSAKGCFAFLTSPLCLQRFARDKGIADLLLPSDPEGEMACLAGDAVLFDDGESVILEEYKFARKGPFPGGWYEKILSLFPDDPVLAGAKDRFVLLSDADMAYFAEYACPVSKHVSIDPKTGAAKQNFLYDQEEVPSETLFYAPMTQIRSRPDLDAAVQSFFGKFEKETLIQFGAKGTTGIGYCSVKFA
jgi:CRISPR-associated protein Cmr4